MKNKNDFAFFYRITKMLSSEKIAEFGKTFLKDLQLLTVIVKNGKKEDAKIYVDKLHDRKRKILFYRQESPNLFLFFYFIVRWLILLKYNIITSILSI